MSLAELTVAHVVPGPWLDQTETWLYNQVRHLPPQVTSHIFCESTKNLDQFRLPNIHSLCGQPYWQSLSDRVARQVRIRRHWGFVERHLKRTGARVMHSHFGWIGWENCRVAHRLGLKHVVTFYGLDVNYLPTCGWRGPYQELFGSADLVLCEGPHMAECIVGLGCPGAKVCVHRLGINLSQIQYRPRQWSRTGPLRVLIAASFREKKGIPYALEALGRLHRDIPLEITIIGDAGGSAQSQVEKRRIHEAIQKHGLKPIVRLLGFQSYQRVFDEAYRHHVFLSPSVTATNGDTEGGAPVALIDMVATGMPVVSTRHCDIPEVIEDGVTGLLADERDVDGLVDQLRFLVQHPEAWRGMTDAGRHRMEQMFDAQIQGTRLAQLYHELAYGSQAGVEALPATA